MKKNEYLLSVTEVKNILKQQSREALIELIIDSYKTIPQLKEYVSVKYSNKDTIEQIFKVYKDKVHDVLEQYYAEIKWLELEDLSAKNKELVQIKEYIADRIGKRNDLPDFMAKILL